MIVKYKLTHNLYFLAHEVKFLLTILYNLEGTLNQETMNKSR